MSNTGRDDYDAIFHLSGIEPGEPIFILRAKDKLAADTIQCWAQLASDAGIDTAVIELALKQADRMMEWPTKKLPDAHVGGNAPQLRYEFTRRQHRDLHDLPTKYGRPILPKPVERVSVLDASESAALKECEVCFGEKKITVEASDKVLNITCPECGGSGQCLDL